MIDELMVFLGMCFLIAGGIGFGTGTNKLFIVFLYLGIGSCLILLAMVREKPNVEACKK